MSFKEVIRSNKGFTLIELLIVIAVIGVLAAVVLVAIDPIEQINRGRDAGRKSTAGQLSKAVQAYYTSRQAVWPTANATWVTTLVTAGELKSAPAAVTGGTACTTNAQNGWCYTTDAVEAAVWARLASKSEIAKCVAGTNPYFMWDSTRGTTCLVCNAAEPTLNFICNPTQ